MMEEVVQIKKSVVVPQLRFTEFDSNWEQKRLRDLFKINAGGDIPDQNVKFNRTDEYKYPIYANAEKNKGLYGYSDIYKSDENVITIAGRGANFGIAHVRTEKFYPIVRLLVLKPFHKLDLFFFQYQINRINLFKESTGVPQLTAPQIASYKLYCPSIQEQQKIASFLSSVDKKIQQLTRKKELLEKYKKGVMQKLFPPAGGQVPEIRFKKDDGGNFPEWEEKRLGDLLKIGSGKDYKHLQEGDIPVFGTGGYMLSVNEPIYSGETVFIGRKGTIDKPFYFKGDFWTVDTLFYTHSFSGVVVKFIEILFQLINWKKYNEASGVPSLSKTTIEKIKVKIPEFEEQRKISGFISSIDIKIDSVEIQLKKMQQFKKGLLQQMFV